MAIVYAVWFGRLTWHLAACGGHPEEGRYVHMRDWAGRREDRSFLVFYLMQASWVWLFSLPAWVVSQGSVPPLPLLGTGNRHHWRRLAGRWLPTFNWHDSAVYLGTGAYLSRGAVAVFAPSELFL